MAPLNVIALVSGGKDSLFSLLHVQRQGGMVVALANLGPSSAGEWDGGGDERCGGWKEGEEEGKRRSGEFGFGNEGGADGSVDVNGGLNVDGGEEEEDLDSFMYQTAGHSVIPLYAHALGLPLYRRAISGTAVNSSRDYAYTPPGSVPDLDFSATNVETQQRQQQQQEQQEQQDETEDLVPLLRAVLQKHPEANAVSTGAILSTYQRTRVESVALRLQLIPLAFLWQWPLLPPYSQTGLLRDMAAVGQRAVIVKTASAGLDESFLGEDVGEPQTINRLKKAVSRFGDQGDGAVVGEGGEFETLALDGPAGLWKKRIRIVETDKSLGGEQAVLRFRRVVVEEKVDDFEGKGTLKIPNLFDEEFASVLEKVENTSKIQSTSSSTTSTSSSDVALDQILDSQPLAMISIPQNTIHETSSIFTYTNLCASPTSFFDITTTKTKTNPKTNHNHLLPSRQLTLIFLRLHHILTMRSLPRHAISHTTLLLRSMSDFTILNPIYAQFFDFVNPPARVTVAVGERLGEGVDVMLGVVLDKIAVCGGGGLVRDGLHVQSRSYWAPANIGPYSQAVGVRLPFLTAPPRPSIAPQHGAKEFNEDEEELDYASYMNPGSLVYVAGQIPLVPATMEVYSMRGFAGQAVLSLQHLWRVGRAKGVKWWIAGVAFIPSSTRSEAEERVRIAQEAWKCIHSTASRSGPYGSGNEEADEEGEVESIDPWDRLNRPTRTFNDITMRTPIPDWSAMSLSSQTTSSEYVPPCFVAQVEALPRGVDIEWSAAGLNASSIRVGRDAGDIGGFVSRLEHSDATFWAVEMKTREAVHALGELCAEGWNSGTLYVGPGFRDMGVEGTSAFKGLQWVPCRRVWGEGGGEVWAVLLGRLDG